MRALRWRLRRHAVATCLLLLTAGCAFVAPRFPQDIQANFAREDMRKLTTRSLELYYPARLQATALRVAARMEGCVEQLRGKTWSREQRGRVLVYLTGSDFNNAYVQGDYASSPEQMVLPSHMTLELFHLFGLGEVDIGDVSCHESVHYVQLQQTSGVWGFLNKVTGGLFQPNSLTESWFLEGLATFYEGRLGRETGRPHSPVWRGWYESVVQEEGARLDPGYLSPEHRALDPFGGNYVTGMHFVEYLATRYGEDKLWKLINEQGDSILPFLAVTLRFKRVYGRDIGSLFDEYMRQLRQRRDVRERPESQHVWVKQAGYFSRLASHPESGATALVSAGREEIPRLTVREADGRVRFSSPLIDLLPGRSWVLGSPDLVSGMSFTRDGAWLYLVMADLYAVGNYQARLWKVDARTGSVEQTWGGLSGMGGGVTPDGKGYVFVDVHEDLSNLVRLDLETGKREALTHLEPRTAVGPATISPDGTRMVFPTKGINGWDLVVREADGSLRWLTRDGLFNYSPRWLDGERIVFLREYEGRLQAHVMTVATREITRITNAPHLVMDVNPIGADEVVFLNRDGQDFTIDRAPIAAMPDEARPDLESPPGQQPASPGNASLAQSTAPEGAPPVQSATPGAPPPEQQPSPPGGSPPEPQAAPPGDVPLTPPPLPGEEFVQFPSPPPPPEPSTPAPVTDGAPQDSEAPSTSDASPSPASPQATDAPTEATAVASLDLDAPVTAPPPVSPPVTVLSDEPYSTLEGFFIPEYRLPYVYALTDEDDDTKERVIGGLALAGQDRLGFHAYALTLTFDTEQDEPSGYLSYGNAQLAPWYILLSAARVRDNDRTDLQGTLFATRTFWTTPVTFGVLALNREYDATERFPKLVSRLIGPEASVAYFAGSGTSYGGTQRGLGLSLSGGVYPKAFSRSDTLGDIRVGVEGYLGGLPFTGRDNLRLTAVGRFLPGAPDGLLEVGGISAGEIWYSSRRSTESAPLPLQLDPGVAFSEYLRGYEDRTYRARNALVGSATYRYRIPIDYGWASTIYVLPSLFISDFDLEGFGSIARTDNRDNHGAVGASATLRLTFGQAVPVSLFYQYAYRFDRGLSDLHLFGFGF